MSERKDVQHGGTLSTEQANLKGYAMGILLGGIFGDLKSLPEQTDVPGKHTGDAAMVFCLVDALADTEHGAKLDPIKLRQNFDRWYIKGAHRSMDKNHELTLLGKTLKKTFKSFTPTDSSPLVPLQNDGTNPGSAAVLRTAPVAIKYHDDAKSCLLAAYVQSRTTHGHPETAHCAMLFAFLLYRALGLVKEGKKPELGRVLGGRPPVVDEINQHLRTMCANDGAWLKKHYIQDGQLQLLQEFPSDLLETVSCLASSDSRFSWNWRSNDFLQARKSAGLQIETVNCLDALAVSLHVLHTQGSLFEQAPEKFEQAVLLCSQLSLGRNSLAVLVCQLVGALYGTVSQGPSNPPAWFKAVYQSNPKSVKELCTQVQQLLARPSPREAQDGGWFELLFGFKERVSGDGTAFTFNQQQYASNNEKIGSESVYIIRQRTQDSPRQFIAGNFEVPTLRDLRQEVLALVAQRRKVVNSTDALVRVSVEHKVTFSAFNEHCDSDNKGAVFQVASQFNCLEFVDPKQTPGDGITCYYRDCTQGPDCALAAAPALFFRQYCRQGAGSQLNTLAKVIELLEQKLPSGPNIGSNRNHPLQVKNGYAFCSPERMEIIRTYLESTSTTEVEKDEIRERQQVGLVTNAGVPFAKREDNRFVLRKAQESQLVHQVLCSALSIGYAARTEAEAHKWYPLARLVLEAQYEATLLFALRRYLQQAPTGTCKPVKVFLAFVGGGWFKNRSQDIAAAITRAIQVVQKVQIPAGPGGEPALRICVLHYREFDPYYVQQIQPPRRTAPAHVPSSPAVANDESVWRARPGGTALRIYMGNICHESGPGRGALVNAANSGLQHGAGVAWALKKAGGKDNQGRYKIDVESTEWLRKNGGRLGQGQVAETTAGNMQAQSILHVVGPRVAVPGEATGTESQELAGAVQAVLTHAEERKFDWISIPAISTGVFGFPKKKGTKIILETCAKFCHDLKRRHLKEIRLVNIDAETTQDLVSALKSLNFY